MHEIGHSGEGRLAARRIDRPERFIPVAFLIAIVAGTLVLMLPAARAGATLETGGAPFVVALFTATSAVCITGLTVVDTPTYWSTLGHVAILVLLQLGGLGITTGATLLGVFITRRSRLFGRLTVSTEMKGLQLGDLAGVLRLVVVLAIVVEGVLALWLAGCFLSLGLPWPQALWQGLFHGVSAYNNAGFSSLYSDFSSVAGHWPLLVGLMLGVVVGGIGFPVLYELRQRWGHAAGWSIHTKLTLLGTAILLPLGFVLTLGFEWANPATLGQRPWDQRLLGALFHSVMTRSGGFSVEDMGALTDATSLASYGLMLVGGGSASTAGGIKVTTFMLIGFIVWAQLVGTADANAYRRRIAPDVQRQAFTIALVAVGIVGAATLTLLALSGLPMPVVIFDVISAFANVGLSTGVAAELPDAGQLLLTVLMYTGRVGTITLAAALATRRTFQPYRYPEERPIVG